MKQMKTEDMLRKKNTLSGSSAVRLIESLVCEGTAGFKTGPSARNLFSRPVHAASGPGALSTISGLAAKGLRTAGAIHVNRQQELDEIDSAVSRHLPLVLQLGMSSGFDPAHDVFQGLSGTGAFQFFAVSQQEAIDLTLIAHRVAELSLIPGVIGMDPGRTAAGLAVVDVPSADVIRRYLGSPDDLIDCPTPAQKIVFGKSRRRIPDWFQFDFPTANLAYKKGRARGLQDAAKLAFYLEHLPELLEKAFDEYHLLTGRRVQNISQYRVKDAEHVIVVTGSLFDVCRPLVDLIRAQKKVKVGCIALRQFRPFPSKDLVEALLRAKTVTVLDHVTPSAFGEAPLFSDVSAAFHRATENGSKKNPVYPGYPAIKASRLPDLISAICPDTPTDSSLYAVLGQTSGTARRYFVDSAFTRKSTYPKHEVLLQEVARAYPDLQNRSLTADSGGEPRLVESDDVISAVLIVPAQKGWTPRLEIMCESLRQLHGIEVRTVAEESVEPGFLRITMRFFKAGVDGVPLKSNLSMLALPASGLQASRDLLDRLTPGAGLTVLETGSHLPDWVIAIAAEKKCPLFLLDRKSEWQFAGLFLRQVAARFGFTIDPANAWSVLQKIHDEREGSVWSPESEAGIADGFNLKSVDVSSIASVESVERDLPLVVRQYRDQGPAYSKVSRFYHDTAYFYQTGETGELTADPFQAVPVVPPATSTFIDAAARRSHLPELNAEKCTGCGDCFVYCPHAAIPPVAISLEALIRSGAEIATQQGTPITQLTPGIRNLAKVGNKLLRSAEKDVHFPELLKQAFDELLDQMKAEGEKRLALEDDFTAVAGVLAAFPAVVTDSFFNGPESVDKGSGELFSLFVDPNTCTGCGLCAEICPEGALEMSLQTSSLVATQRAALGLWEKLPDTPGETIRRLQADKEYNPVAAMMLSRNYYLSMIGGDYSEKDASAKSTLRAVTATVEAIMQPRILELLERLNKWIGDLSEKIHARLSEALPSENFDALAATLSEAQSGKIPADTIIAEIGKQAHLKMVDATLLKRWIALRTELKNLVWALTEGPSGVGRSRFGIAFSAQPLLDDSRAFPGNVFMNPVWMNRDDASPSRTEGLFRGHVRHLLDNIRLIKRAELEVSGDYDPGLDDPKIAALSWEGLTAEERALIPPVLLVAARQDLSPPDLGGIVNLLGAGLPIKVILLDRACHSYDGSAGDFDVDPALTALMVQKAYVLRSMLARPAHFHRGIFEGLRFDGPALFHLFTPERELISGEGIAWRMQPDLALKTRVFPLMRFNPEVPHRAKLDLSDNPDPETNFVSGDESHPSLYTLADWAVRQKNVSERFEIATDATGQTVDVADYLQQDTDDRKNETATLLDQENEETIRYVVPRSVVQAAELAAERWRLMREMAGLVAQDPKELKEKLGRELEQEHSEAIAALKAEYEEKLKTQEQQNLLKVKQKLREKLLILSGYKN